jgi:hypothetical protein
MTRYFYRKGRTEVIMISDADQSFNFERIFSVISKDIPTNGI